MQSTPRIPLALQSVILASNRGDEVQSAPTLNVASKVYHRGHGYNDSVTEQSVDDSPRKRAQYRMFSFRSSATNKVAKEASNPAESLKFASPRRSKSFDFPTPSPLSTVFRIESKVKSDVECRSPVKTNSPSPQFTTPKRTKSGESSRKSSRLPSMSPQSYLDALMSNRGYSTERVSTIETAYYNRSTPLQKASYQGYLINVARSGDLDALADLLKCGLSPNPSNLHSESLCHMVCRLGKSPILQTMLDCGTSLDVCDDYGRTPLHDACWAAKPAFDVVDMIMTAGSDTSHLFTMVDNRGSTPLSYIRQEHWAQWMEFLQSKKDVYWPVLDKSNGKKAPPAIALELPNSRPRCDPGNALPTDLAIMVASGSMSPLEARQVVDDEAESDESEVVTFDDTYYDDDSSCSSDYSETDADTSCSTDEGDLDAILAHFHPSGKGTSSGTASGFDLAIGQPFVSSSRA